MSDDLRLLERECFEARSCTAASLLRLWAVRARDKRGDLDPEGVIDLVATLLTKRVQRAGGLVIQASAEVDRMTATSGILSYRTLYGVAATLLAGGAVEIEAARVVDQCHDEVTLDGTFRVPTDDVLVEAAERINAARDVRFPGGHVGRRLRCVTSETKPGEFLLIWHVSTGPAKRTLRLTFPSSA